jgi:hypothetical protein
MPISIHETGGRTLTKQEAENYSNTYKATSDHKLKCNICGAIADRTPCRCWKNRDTFKAVADLTKRVEILEQNKLD